MNLHNPTYVCLDIPEPIKSRIRAIREQFCDRLTGFPIEITIAGSSGIGAISGHAEWATVEAKLIAVCGQTGPITARFGGVVRFPGTDTFVLSLGDPQPFVALHDRLRHSGIPFEPSIYPFFPHCSLRMSGALSADAINRIFAIRIEDEFEIQLMALQARDEGGRVGRVWEHHLSGRSA